MIIRERQNIIDLIRKDAYHSCIITSYSFDFIFFEERLMPALKSAGVKNINLFLDGNYFDEQLENSIGREFQSQRTYSINTIYQKGIFHPKILLFIGQKQALLIIGSGNISTSGMSSNDEVWGAFHISSIESPNAPLLSECWFYLEGFLESSLGFNREKINWIFDRAPFFNQLKQIKPNGFIPLNRELDIAFIANDKNGSIYQKLHKIIGDEKIESLTIVSPFFDKDGKALTNFLNDFEIDRITCLTDTDSGILPLHLDDTLHSSFNFYEWNDCIKGGEQDVNRLHAKIFDFMMVDGTEFLLIGSSNATKSALGSLLESAQNDESSILLKRRSKVGYLEELGISISGIQPFVLSEKKAIKSKPTEIHPSSGKQFKILHAEKDGDQLHLILNTKASDQIEIIIRDKNLNLSENHLLNGGQKEVRIKLNYPDKAEQIFLSQNNNRISNIRPIQDKFMLSKTNPDPRQAKINKLIEDLSENSEFSSIASIFQYLDYTREEEDAPQKTITHRNPSIIKKTAETEYESLSEKEFNELPAVQFHVRESMNHPNVQLADLIRLIGKGMVSRKEKISEDIESSLSSEEPEKQYRGEEQINETQIPEVDGENIKNKLLDHIRKVHQNYFSHIESQIKNQDLDKREGDIITLKEISNFIILFGLLNDLFRKTYQIEAKEFAISYQQKINEELKRIEKNFHLIKSEKVDRDNLKVSFYYVQKNSLENLKNELNKISPTLLIPQKESKSKTFIYKYFKNSTLERNDEDGIKSILAGTLGLFLLHVANSGGFKTYRYEVQKAKMNQFRNTLFEFATVLILRIDWQENELEFRDLLLLDLLHLILPQWTSYEEILSRLEAYQKEKGYSFKKNLESYQTRILQKYNAWRINYKNDRPSLIEIKTTLSNNSIIFKSNIGFASIGFVNQDSIGIRKPGLWKYLNENRYLKLKHPNHQVVVFQ
ncbi:MAG: hypothetical protein HWD85_12975 [Flavobacteriaceae bacterium]|nr:hypothetical protein [Flavobacteriaceae bacterium]